MELEIRNLSKSYDGGKHFALNDFNEAFTTGIYGLLGPNGAGKSTFMNILTQNLRADSGSITWGGSQVHSMGSRFRSKLGYMPQQQNLYDEFSGDEFLWYMAALKGLKKKESRRRIDELLETVNLQDVRYKKIGGYSGGMKQRLLIAQAMLGDPEILIMDEPTAGLDPRERIRVRNFISELSVGKIVIFATHVISDIEFIAGNILLMREGRLIRKGTPEELLEDLNGKVFEIYRDHGNDFEGEHPELLVSNIRYSGGKMCFRVIGEEEQVEGLDAVPARPELEDVYLYYER